MITALIAVGIMVYALSGVAAWLYYIPRLCKALEARWPDEP